MIKRAGLLLLFSLLISSAVWSQEDTATDTAEVQSAPLIQPVTNLKAFDKDNDHGHAIALSWDLSADDGKGQDNVYEYHVERWLPLLMDSIYEIHKEISSTHNLLILTDEGTDGRIQTILTKSIDTTVSESGDTTISKSVDTSKVQRTDEELKAIEDSLKQFAKDLESRVATSHDSYPNSGTWVSVGAPAPSGQDNYKISGTRNRVDKDYLPDKVGLYFRVTAITRDVSISSVPVEVGPVQSSSQLYNSGRTIVLIGVTIFTVLTLIFVQLAKRGAKLYVRPLPGIEAVDEAIGRATEMGRPILYIMGLGAASDIATIASFTILGRVAKKVAEYQTSLIVPCYDPIVMAVGQEVVKSSFLDAGFPDSYNEDSVYFVTQSQFAYVAAVNGTMIRELPATCLYLGKFYAESLLLAETGALAGSIQIAGTDEIPQIPFFIVACDYTLIGEELFAASAYLGREPILLGSLKAQDYAKAAIIVAVIIGLIIVNIEQGIESHTWFSGYRDLFVVTD